MVLKRVLTKSPAGEGSPGGGGEALLPCSVVLHGLGRLGL